MMSGTQTPDIRTQSLVRPITVAEYLFTRLHQIGVRSVHGLPGDYNLVALDYLPSCNLEWVGSVNELNAAYAADGYARVNGISAIITTFGVGELSALNGIAGAFAEHVPVVHIVGCPSTISQRSNLLLHHTLGNGDFDVFANMSSSVSCEVAKLQRPVEIADQIDHTLRECWVRSRPVYIMLPTDMVQQKVEGDRLRTPIRLTDPRNDREREDFVVDIVLNALHEAQNPVILVDACAIRHRALEEVHDLIEKTQLPVFVTPMGKGAVNESHATYGGVYAGISSNPAVIERVESSDLILSIGALKSDFNTSGFSYRTSQLNSIDLHSTHTVVRYSEYPGVTMRGVLRKVIDRIDVSRLQVKPILHRILNEPAPREDGIITQAYLWPRMSHFLKENDVVVTETGTSNFGIWDTRFPPGVTALSQVLWGSIGWSVGACQGAALAVKDKAADRRTILFVGDGSFQLTAQEVSTMIRRGLKPIIFVLCNDGYTIERFIHGMDAEYNDVQTWHYKELVTAFGATDEQAAKIQVKSVDELNALLTDEEFIAAKRLQFVEIYLPRDDAPRALILTAEASARTNAKTE
ncbi:pyruvate decarboxylase [Grosmannia clavigera kw1407]|uniref:Pyruvate decarboxylase n=1 Tax=Grosmannia clavigera (strain kw1407 / UAMH 11150) TaxID=655863 RepID=F0XNG7_GROCL|nr:pyruvate decarboxylase [Grosmannia clavigera kw1407]EFX00900.1 pyruvate decarboxylase [Grosmannia clavigera kw1407]